ncbi:MAG: thiolase family protein [Firmicutes bacterium]|nr:thiolase family protein [Bacillota bacterium]
MDDDAVYIVGACRTPVGRHRGVLKDVRPDDLAALVLQEAVRRAGLDGAEVEDVRLGAANQAGEDNRNVARMAALLAGFPVSVPGVTVNRLCGSSLEAVNSAFHTIRAGEADVIVAGGVESMTRAPLVMMKGEREWASGNRTAYDTTIGWRLTNPKLAALYPPYSMGETAENLAERYQLSREAQDRFALRSQEHARAAQERGAFHDEIVPVAVVGRGGTTMVERDEHPRPDTTLDSLAALRPAFRAQGTVTAGNSSGINDGAAALVLMSGRRLRDHGIVPLGRVVATGVAGVDPAIMGIGPVPATRTALKRADWDLDDLDLVELNEAFAAQCLAVLHDLPVPDERLNVNGGAIALGHPLGASGARILTTLLYAMRARGARRGLATMCIGVGQGIATLVEAAG